MSGIENGFIEIDRKQIPEVEEYRENRIDFPNNCKLCESASRLGSRELVAATRLGPLIKVRWPPIG